MLQLLRLCKILQWKILTLRNQKRSILQQHYLLYLVKLWILSVVHCLIFLCEFHIVSTFNEEYFKSHTQRHGDILHIHAGSHSSVCWLTGAHWSAPSPNKRKCISVQWCQSLKRILWQNRIVLNCSGAGVALHQYHGWICPGCRLNIMLSYQYRDPNVKD